MVKAIETEHIYRVYAADQQSLEKIDDLWKEAIK
jgi:hypothetical protein